MVTRHHTKDKGDIAVAKVMADLAERGSVVLLPLTEHAPFDLVVYLDEHFFRVQVKYRSAKDGRVTVVFTSTWADRHGVHTKPISKDEIDVIAIYCPESNRCYYVDPVQHRVAVSLRLEPPLNHQRNGVNFADDHLVMPPPTVPGLRPCERAARMESESPDRGHAPGPIDQTA